MCILLHLALLLYVPLSKGDDAVHNLTADEISCKIVDLFSVKHDDGRIKELTDKIAKINSYVLNNEIFADLLTNVTTDTNLTETNFYEALQENDHFRFMTTNDSENLYLKLKSKMNRDDILKVVAERGGKGKLIKSARRMMIKKSLHKRDDDEKMHDVVDKLIAEVPKDDHKMKANESIYWDPQGALEDLKEYYDAKRDGRRIYRGERTNIRDWPFMVSIHVMGRFWCGGSLYWNDLVLTSASCLQLLHNNRFFRENPRVVQVRIGSNHSRLGGELVDVLEVYFHPGYDPKTLNNNLAVTRLRRHLAFSFHRIPKIIAISDLPTSIPATAELLVLGWGVTKLSQKLSYEPIFLQKKYIPVYPNTFCKDVYGSKFITDKMFCAGTITTGEGACDHDAGGPAIIGGRLVGIISFGPSICGFTNAPTVFTLVGAFSDWIESVNESMPNYYRAKHLTTLSTKSLIQNYFNTWNDAQTKTQTTKASKLVPVFPMRSKTDPPGAAAKQPFETISTPVPQVEITDVLPSPEVPGALRMEESDGGWSIEKS